MAEKKIKVCFAASSGGHYEQMLMLQPLMAEYDSFVVTEETQYQSGVPGVRSYYMKQVNRKEKTFLPYMLANSARAVKIYRKERPDVVVCFGVLAMIPLCLLAKLAHKKLVYVESFAKVTSGTLTGRLLYRFADRFYVQWPQMLDIYPNAACLGGIY